jgi:hypothetical protein
VKRKQTKRTSSLSRQQPLRSLSNPLQMMPVMIRLLLMPHEVGQRLLQPQYHLELALTLATQLLLIKAKLVLPSKTLPNSSPTSHRPCPVSQKRQFSHQSAKPRHFHLHPRKLQHYQVQASWSHLTRNHPRHSFQPPTGRVPGRLKAELPTHSASRLTA